MLKSGIDLAGWLCCTAYCNNNTNHGTGCYRGTKAEPTKTEEKITLKWALWDYDTTVYWGALIDAYKAVKPNVTIQYTDLGSTDYSTVLAAELSGKGTEFDIVTIKDVPGYATLVQKNTLEPLDDYIKKAGTDLSVFGGITNQVTVNGKLYELPFRSDFWVIFYNKDIFDRKGVPYPTNDMTFEQYDELARKVADTTFGSEDMVLTTTEKCCSAAGVLMASIPF